MTLRILFIFIINLLLIDCVAQKRASSVYLPNRKFSPTQLQADFRYLRYAIEQYHAGAYWYISKDSLRVFFDDYEKTLTDSLTERQFRNQLFEVVEHVKCGHSGINSSKVRQKYFKNRSAKIIPLSLHFIDNQVFVLKNHSKDSTIKIGSRVIQIDGLDTEKIIATMLRANSSDGYNMTNRYYGFESNIQFEYLRLFPERDTFSLIIEQDSIKKICKLPAIAMDTFPFQAIKKEKSIYHNFSNRFYIDEKHKNLAILDLRAEKVRGYKKFYRRVFKYMKTNDLQHLVIDLRGNGGGFMLNPGNLLGYLIDKRDTVEVKRIKKAFQNEIAKNKWVKITERFFHWIPNVERIEHQDSFKLWIKFSPKQKLAYRGNIYVLTDGGTFSAAAFIAAYLKKHQRATFIGQETGGGEVGCSAFLMPHLTLPNTELQYRLPLYRVLHRVNPQQIGRGIIPDFGIDYHLQDVINQRDIEMEKVYELIK